MDNLPIEKALTVALRKQFLEPEAKALESRYFHAKSKLFDEILPWIRKVEPNLTDHGPDHIENVLKNAYKIIEHDLGNLLSEDNKKATLSPLDLYCLCQSILFHDVGNLFGRDDHNLAIPQVMKDEFSQFFTNPRERKIIISAGRAHSGKGVDGTKDTLKDLKSDQLRGDEVKLRDIAAIVRFADELAEGPQRTSRYMLSLDKFPEDSKIHHRYANCIDLHIDPGNERISLNCEIDITVTRNGSLSDDVEKELTELLTYAFYRINKLEQERKYATYYCNIIQPLKKTKVNFEITLNECPVGVSMPPIILDDLIIPGQRKSSVIQGRPDLDISKLVGNIKDYLLTQDEEGK